MMINNAFAHHWPIRERERESERTREMRGPSMFLWMIHIVINICNTIINHFFIPLFVLQITFSIIRSEEKYASLVVKVERMPGSNISLLTQHFKMQFIFICIFIIMEMSSVKRLMDYEKSLILYQLS